MEIALNPGDMTAPGKYARTIDQLPNDIPSLLTIVHGLFIHSDYPDLYGLTDFEFTSQMRDTLPLEKRLEKIFKTSNLPLTETRAVNRREAVTCRDYALMICGFIKNKSIPARVRCGFANYFTPNRYEDHWVCEYWTSNEQRWARVDAQLDKEHCDHLGITFDTADVPEDKFMTANEAWNMIGDKSVSPNLFGHGDTVGEWFVWVNLARDYYSINGQETSAWDNWRDVIGNEPELSSATRKLCDKISNGITSLEQSPSEATGKISLNPFWLISN